MHNAHPRCRSGLHTSAAALAAAAALAVTVVAQDPVPVWPVGATARRFVPVGTYDWRGAATHALITTIWYPAPLNTQVAPHEIGPPAAPLFVLGDWADDAPAATRRFPLIVLSHGTGGSATIMSWLASGLASRGYVVAAVNHPGNNALEPYTEEGFLVWWERARDLSTVIAIAPALGPALTAESLRRISIPMQIVAGDADRIVPVGPNAERLAQLTRNATLTLLPAAGHYTFLATCTDAGRQAQPQLCADAQGVDRDAIHRRTVQLAAQFFDRTLR